MAQPSKSRPKTVKLEHDEGADECPLFPGVPLDDAGFIRISRYLANEDGEVVRKAVIPGKFPPDVDEDFIAEHKTMGPGSYQVQLFDRRGRFTTGQAREVHIDGIPRDPGADREDDEDETDGADEGVEVVQVDGQSVVIPVGLSAREKKTYIDEQRRRADEKAAQDKHERLLLGLLGQRSSGADGELDRVRRELDDRRSEWQGERRRLETMVEDVKREYERRLDRADEERKHEVADIRRALEDFRREADRRAEEDRRRFHEDLARRDRDLEELRRDAREQIATRDRELAALREEKLGLTERYLEERARGAGAGAGAGEPSMLSQVAEAVAPVLQSLSKNIAPSPVPVETPAPMVAAPPLAGTPLEGSPFAPNPAPIPSQAWAGSAPIPTASWAGARPPSVPPSPAEDAATDYVPPFAPSREAAIAHATQAPPRSAEDYPSEARNDDLS